MLSPFASGSLLRQLPRRVKWAASEERRTGGRGTDSRPVHRRHRRAGPRPGAQRRDPPRQTDPLTHSPSERQPSSPSRRTASGSAGQFGAVGRGAVRPGAGPHVGADGEPVGYQCLGRPFGVPRWPPTSLDGVAGEATTLTQTARASDGTPTDPTRQRRSDQPNGLPYSADEPQDFRSWLSISLPG